MINFIDRIPGEGKSGRVKITHEDGSEEYVKIARADDPLQTGTPINRTNMMALQGMAAKLTSFSSNKITEQMSNGDVLTTTFYEDIIIETLVPKSGESISKTIYFNGSSISEVMGEHPVAVMLFDRGVFE